MNHVAPYHLPDMSPPQPDLEWVSVLSRHPHHRRRTFLSPVCDRSPLSPFPPTTRRRDLPLPRRKRRIPVDRVAGGMALGLSGTQFEVATVTWK